MDAKEFKDFFQPYAKNVDNANQLAFWRLSDHIIREIILSAINRDLSDDAVILDAGGGTGRWVAELSQYYKCRFLLYDLSEDMLDIARQRLTGQSNPERFTIINGDLSDMSQVHDGSVDYIISIYSPISFVAEPTVALRELYRVLKPRGKILLMAHGFYNSLFSKIVNYQAEGDELLQMSDKEMVKWARYVPELHTFSQESMSKLFKSSGFTPLKFFGVPVFAQPGHQDFDPTNKDQSPISKKLAEDESFYKAVFDLEMKFNSKPEVVNRGMNIFGLAQKE